jgi:hypothetical protein
MNTKTAFLTTAMLATMALLSIPAASAEPDTWCAVENYACYCLDFQGAECNGIATSQCTASVGASRDLMVGLDCKSLPIGR